MVTTMVTLLLNCFFEACFLYVNTDNYFFLVHILAVNLITLKRVTSRSNGGVARKKVYKMVYRCTYVSH